MELDRQYRNKFLWVLLAILLLRLVAMWLVPLTDTTESRYAEIARKMLETGDWVTPQFDYGVPFWAKPPLSTWVSALSMKFFGVNEFASRLPSLLCCLALLFFMYSWLKEYKANIALLSVVILSTSFLFFGSAGLVMTDLCLIFASTLAMVAFWNSVVASKGRHWGYIFFVSLAIGLLAKGPLILVLVGLPTGVWTILNRQLKSVWVRLPWIIGTLVMVALAAPWYYIAEQHTPGFLQYFLIGEHFSRFLISGWKGDMYGHAHSEPLGMIWLYLVFGFTPWIALIAVLIVKNRSKLTWRLLLSDSWLNYLLLWSIMPIIFFTFAHNIISPYVLPAMPACAILIAEFFVTFDLRDNKFKQKIIFWLSMSIPILAVFTLTFLLFKPHLSPKRSEKDLVKKYYELRDNERSRLIYYRHRVYSAEFYTAGKAKVMGTRKELESLLENDTTDFLAIENRFDSTEITDLLQNNFRKIASFHGTALYKECDIHNHSACGY
jgi:4-amino-4-deoxy-L-arabinose transferase-like glycosyltransferase